MVTPAAYAVLVASAIDYADDHRARYTRGWNERFLEALDMYGLALTTDVADHAQAYIDGRIEAPKPATTGRQYPWPSRVIVKPT